MNEKGRRKFSSFLHLFSIGGSLTLNQGYFTYHFGALIDPFYFPFSMSDHNTCYKSISNLEEVVLKLTVNQNEITTRLDAIAS